MAETIAVSSVTIALSTLNKRLDNINPIYEQWGKYLTGTIDRSFRQQQSPEGKPWQALSPEYRKRKERYGSRKTRSGSRDKRSKPKSGGRLILQWSGRLRGSIAYRVDSRGLEVGSPLKVGNHYLLAIHHYGAPAAGIPSRSPLPIDAQGQLLPQTRVQLTRIAIDYLVRG